MRPLFALSTTLALLTAGPVLAQSDPAVPPSSFEQFPFTRQRATNLARMYAERLNGGLGVYRAALCMHNRGGGDCLIQGDAQGYIFRFLGGPPGWQVLGLPPDRETEIEVSPDGRAIVKVLYNGEPRQPSAAEAAPPTALP